MKTVFLKRRISWVISPLIPSMVQLDSSLPISKKSPFFYDSLAHWCLTKAFHYRSIGELLSGFIDRIKDIDSDICFSRVVVQTLHPQLRGLSYKWEDGETSFLQISHDVVLESAFIKSPLYPVINKQGGVRCRIIDDSKDQFPIIKDFRQKGYSDYVAMPIVFSDGTFNVVTLATRNKKGFSTEIMGSVFNALKILTPQIENFVAKENMKTFLHTYLGKSSGQQVYDGKIRRGDGEVIDAVVFFSDMRHSTELIESVDVKVFLRILDHYLGAFADAILKNEGEIISYIGDGILAIFPIGANSPKQVCEFAYNAVKEGLAKIDQLNNGQNDLNVKIDCGIALHRGRFVYGNIGSECRLSFTTIGSTINQTIRMEDLNKKFGSRVTLSKEVVDYLDVSQFQSQGIHPMKGVSEEIELFSI